VFVHSTVHTVRDALFRRGGHHRFLYNVAVGFAGQRRLCKRPKYFRIEGRSSADWMWHRGEDWWTVLGQLPADIPSPLRVTIDGVLCQPDVCCITSLEMRPHTSDPSVLHAIFLEDEFRFLFESHAWQPVTIFDAGSNAGYATHQFALMFHMFVMFSTIVSMESSVDNFEMLEQNAKSAVKRKSCTRRLMGPRGIASCSKRWFRCVGMDGTRNRRRRTGKHRSIFHRQFFKQIPL